MEKINDYLESFNAADKRSALYYLTRYIKQSYLAHDEYKKDIFEDGKENKPDEKIKSLTFKMIAFVENSAGKKAIEFSEDEFHFWMDSIADIENAIDPDPSKNQIQKALSELEKFDTPRMHNIE